MLAIKSTLQLKSKPLWFDVNTFQSFSLMVISPRSKYQEKSRIIHKETAKLKIIFIKLKRSTY